jgi:broad specificity phosphatase PhoE
VGSTDAPLDELGRSQAAALAEILKERRPGRCVSSPLLRARQTAETVSGAAGLTVEVDDDLREVDFGCWEGKTLKEISSMAPVSVQRWADLAPDFAFPGGESLESFLNRVRRVADRLVQDPADKVLAITHGGVIRAILCHLLGLPTSKYVAFEVGLASLCVVRIFDGKGVLSELNNQARLSLLE